MHMRKYLQKTYTLYAYYWLTSPLGSWQEAVYGGYMARLARRLGYASQSDFGLTAPLNSGAI